MPRFSPPAQKTRSHTTPLPTIHAAPHSSCQKYAACNRHGGFPKGGACVPPWARGRGGRTPPLPPARNRFTYPPMRTNSSGMTTHENTAVILVAAGRGTRMGGDLPKQWRALGGQSVMARTIAAFRAAGLRRLILVIHPADEGRAKAFGLPYVHGGRTRAA